MIDAYIEALRENQTNYSRASGTYELLDAVSKRYRRLYGKDIGSEKIIAAVTVIIYAVTSLPSSTVPNFCTFSGYVSCRNISIGSNDLVSRAILLFSNSQQYAVENAIPPGSA